MPHYLLIYYKKNISNALNFYFEFLHNFLHGHTNSIDYLSPNHKTGFEIRDLV